MDHHHFLEDREVRMDWYESTALAELTAVPDWWHEWCIVQHLRSYSPDWDLEVLEYDSPDRDDIELFPDVTPMMQPSSVTERDLPTLFAPSAVCILRKALQMEERLRLSKEHQDLRRQLQCSVDPALLVAIVEKIESTESEIRLATRIFHFGSGPNPQQSEWERLHTDPLQTGLR